MKNKLLIPVLVTATLAIFATRVLLAPPQPAPIRSASLKGTAIDSTANPAPPVLPGPSTSSVAASSGRKNAAGYLEVGFDTLSGFEATVTYEMVSTNPAAPVYAPKLSSAVPDTIKALDRKEIAVQGFMLPLKEEAGRVGEFVLLKNQMMCCFGAPPKVNEWVHVRIKGQGIKPLMDQVITIYGTIHVGQYNENRTLLGLYQIEGDGVGLTPQL